MALPFLTAVPILAKALKYYAIANAIFKSLNDPKKLAKQGVQLVVSLSSIGVFEEMLDKVDEFKELKEYINIKGQVAKAKTKAINKVKEPLTKKLEELKIDTLKLFKENTKKADMNFDPTNDDEKLLVESHTFNNSQWIKKVTYTAHPNSPDLGNAVVEFKPYKGTIYPPVVWALVPKIEYLEFRSAESPGHFYLKEFQQLTRSVIGRRPDFTRLDRKQVSKVVKYTQSKNFKMKRK